MSALLPCDLCGAPAERQRPTWPDAGPGSAAAPYRTCPDCGLVQCNPRPDAAEMADFHRAHYAAASDDAVEPERLAKMSPAHSAERLYAPKYQQWARGLLQDLQRHLGAGRARPIRLLEIGCASGGILKAARDLQMQAAGTDVSPEAAQIGVSRHGLDIRVGLIEEMGLPAAAFDLVILHDVIEHVPSPSALLAECARLMDAGAVLYIHTVNVASRTAREAGAGFYLADASGGHVCLPSPDTIARYARKAGLEIVSIATSGYRIVQRERDRAALRGLRRARIRLLENLGHEWVKRTGQGHFLTAILRK